MERRHNSFSIVNQKKYMRAVITKNKASSIFYEGRFYDTGKNLDLSFSDAFRLSNVANVSAVYGSVPYDSELWKKEKFINFFGDIDTQSGFGNVSYYLIKESSDKLEIASTGKIHEVRDQIVFASQNRLLRQAGAMIWHDQPRERWLYSPFKKNIAIIPWETTVIPSILVRQD